MEFNHFYINLILANVTYTIPLFMKPNISTDISIKKNGNRVHAVLNIYYQLCDANMDNLL